MANERGRHRINAVQEMTGVRAATLRTWERRYQLLKPERNENNTYRLYSDEDVERVRRMSALCAEGVAPREAARRILSEEPLAPENPAWVQVALQAARALDAASLEAVLVSAFGWGRPIEVVDELFRPTLEQLQSESPEILRLVELRFAAWMRNALTMVQPALSAPAVVIATIHDDDLAGLEAALRVAPQGWRSRYIGRRTPPEAVLAAEPLGFQALILNADPESAPRFKDYSFSGPIAVLCSAVVEVPKGWFLCRRTDELTPWLADIID